jgi:Helicase conserved C-terminal domain
VALAHIAAVGQGPNVRTLMHERGAALEALGVSRHAGQFTRLISHTLQIMVKDDAPAWRMPVLFRVPVAAAPVWAFYRSGDAAALQAALGSPPPYPHAAALQAHLESLVARSLEHKPKHIDTLLPRLQSECATPQGAAELQAACSRAQERWEHRATELDTLEGLNSELAFQGYPDTFEKARQLQRSVTLYVGPPNSGKTHAAFERLAQAMDGAYLAPLRLLALEGRDRLVARGVPCSLLTGEENVPADQARVVSSTIEMVGTNKPIDVAVIDEAQMIFDNARGWAWTQAIVAVPANEVIIICSAYAVPAIENLLGLCGERCTVRHFERKQHVQLLPHPVPISALQLGDAVVAFSRRDVLMLRDQIAASGHPVSVIYGALPPEVRRREAERFSSGESHILVATDAIGMGLNLPIRRVLFSTMSKFDGQGDRPLGESEVHQIAGRAGRFGMHDEGFVGVLKEAEPTAARMLREHRARRWTSRRRWHRTAGTSRRSRHACTATRCARCWACSSGNCSWTTRTLLWPSSTRCWSWPSSWTAAPRSSRSRSASSTRRRRWTHAPSRSCRRFWTGAAATPSPARPGGRGSWTRWTVTAGSTAWSRPCAPARCGCGWTCASPACTATWTRCTPCAGSSTTASNASSRASARWPRCGSAQAATDRADSDSAGTGRADPRSAAGRLGRELVAPQHAAGGPVVLGDVEEHDVHAVGRAAERAHGGLGERLGESALLFNGAALEELDADGGHGGFLWWGCDQSR